MLQTGGLQKNDICSSLQDVKTPANTRMQLSDGGNRPESGHRASAPTRFVKTDVRGNEFVLPLSFTLFLRHRSGETGGGQIDTTTGDRRTSNRSACLLVEHQLELTRAVRIRCVHCISMRLHICANKWQLHFVHTGRWARVCQCQRVTTNHPVGAESQQYASRCERDGCA